jgi:colanic acid/amylovoran biosynthesis glycosyltransferase
LKSLYLFTSSYPYDKVIENTFLEPEIKILAKSFHLTLVPLQTGENIFKVDSGVVVNSDYAKANINKMSRFCKLLLKYTFWRMMFYEIFTRPFVLISKNRFMKLLSQLYYALTLCEWLKSEVTAKEKDAPIFYTYWFDSSASAVCLLKQEGFKCLFITRAHGFDLYEGEQNFGYIPFRLMQLRMVDKVFCISDNGYNYLADKYPEYKNKMVFSPIGIPDHNILCGSSKDGIFRIVSCSFLISLKRVDLIIKTLAIIGRKHGDLKWEWYHIGNGEEENTLKELAKSALKDNVKYRLLGRLENQDVFQFYKNTTLDLFINLSSSEGRPVSVIEAMSCGLPVLATDVGGVKELVRNGRNGVLIPKIFSCEEISDIIISLRSNPILLQKMKEESRVLFSENLLADKSIQAFVDDLNKITID